MLKLVNGFGMVSISRSARIDGCSRKGLGRKKRREERYPLRISCKLREKPDNGLVKVFLRHQRMTRVCSPFSMESAGAFRDLFWRLKKRHPEKISASCPDVMFQINTRDRSDEDLVAFANKHAIHRIVEPCGQVRWYGCRLGRSYTAGRACPKRKGLAVSPADMENLADAVKFVMRECENAGIYYCEMQDGTLMGDARSYISRIHLPRVHGWLKWKGWHVTWRAHKSVNPIRNDPCQATTGKPPTKVLIAGQWMNHPRNPGLFARNRYGPGTYQHVEHWGTLGGTSGWHFYSTGKSMPMPHAPSRDTPVARTPCQGTGTCSSVVTARDKRK